MREAQTDPTLLDLERVYMHAPIGLCCFNTDLQYVYINNWLAAINGIPPEEHLGRTIGEVLPDVAAGVESQLRDVIETGQPLIGGRVDAATPAEPADVRTFQHNYEPVRSEDGTVVGVSAFVQDVTEQVRVEQHRTNMVHELDHRVKNTLATVLALCKQTIATSRSLEDFQQAYTARLQAMARTHEALASEHWRGVSLSEVLRITFEPYRQSSRERVTTESDDLLLPARVTTPLSLALNELATNAAKHGALATETGRVEVF